MNKQEIIDKALSIKGYTDRDKLQILLEICQNSFLGGDILEIGSAFGRSTFVFLLSSEKKVWSIDPHTGEDYGDRKIGGDSYDEFVNNLKSNNLFNRVNIVKTTTEEASKIIPEDKLFSIALIDGLHTAMAIKTDLDFTYSRTQIGGIIILDDYFEPSVKDYSEEIDRFVQDKKINLRKDKGLIWFER